MNEESVDVVADMSRNGPKNLNLGHSSWYHPFKCKLLGGRKGAPTIASSANIELFLCTRNSCLRVCIGSKNIDKRVDKTSSKLENEQSVFFSENFIPLIILNNLIRFDTHITQ